jgi:hypothetical protein
MSDELLERLELSPIERWAGADERANCDGLSHSTPRKSGRFEVRPVGRHQRKSGCRGETRSRVRMGA